MKGERWHLFDLAALHIYYVYCLRIAVNVLAAHNASCANARFFLTISKPCRLMNHTPFAARWPRCSGVATSAIANHKLDTPICVLYLHDLVSQDSTFFSANFLVRFNVRYNTVRSTSAPLENEIHRFQFATVMLSKKRGWKSGNRRTTIQFSIQFLGLSCLVFLLAFGHTAGLQYWLALQIWGPSRSFPPALRFRLAPTRPSRKPKGP